MNEISCYEGDIMRSSNRFRNTSSDDTGWTLPIFIVVFLGIITFQAIRALAKPNTRDYRPYAYDRPYSRRAIVDFAVTLGSARIAVASVSFLTLIIGVLFFFQLLSGAQSGRGNLPLIALIALSLVVTFLSFLSARSIFPFAAAAFVFALITGLCTLIAPTLTLVFLSGSLISLGVCLLYSAILPGHEREIYRVWIELAPIMLFLTAIVAFVLTQQAFLFIGGLTSLTLLCAAVFAPRISDRERLLTFIASLIVLVGLFAAWTRPNVPFGALLLLCAAVIVFAASLLARNAQMLVSHIPGSIFADTNSFLAPEPTLIVLPSKHDFAPQTAAALVSGLLKLSESMILSIVARAGQGIAWEVSPIGNSTLFPQIAAEIDAHSKGTQTVVADQQRDVNIPAIRQVLLFALTNDYAAPLPSAEDIVRHDPLTVLTQRMSALSAEQGERVSYQIVVTAVSEEARSRASQRLQQGKIRPLAALRQDLKNPIAGLDETVIQAKLQQSLYHCFVALIVETKQVDRLPLLSQAARDVEQFFLSGHNRLVLALQSEPFAVERPDVAMQSDVLRLLERWKQEQLTSWRSILCVLSAPEIAALWHLPSNEHKSDEIAWTHGRVPESVFDPTDAVPLGETVTPGMRGKTVYLKSRDRTTHHYIAGMPKTGKSTLMQRLIQADIAAGHGLAIIDPHGELIRETIRTSIPPNRRNDVVLLKICQTDYPVPLNPLRIPSNIKIPEAMNYLMFVLQKIYDDIWLIGQTENHIVNAVQLLLTDPDATLLDIFRLFQDDTYLALLLDNLSTRDTRGLGVNSLRQFWEFYRGKSPGEKEKILSPIVSRTQAFVRTEILERMMCHPDTLNYQQLMSDRKIVMVDLSGNGILQDVDNLATILISGFFLAAFSLGKAPTDEPRFYLYVDEIERTSKAPFDKLLSESRKYGLAAILANQYVSQMPEQTLEAILGTVGITTVFQLGFKDGRFLSPRFEPQFTANDLMNLDLHRIAVRMRHGDKTLPAFELKTQPVTPIDTTVSEAELQTDVSQQFRSGDEVKQWCDERNRRIHPESTPKSSKSPRTKPMGGKATVTDVEPDN